MERSTAEQSQTSSDTRVSVERFVDNHVGGTGCRCRGRVSYKFVPPGGGPREARTAGRSRDEEAHRKARSFRDRAARIQTGCQESRRR